MWRTRQWLASGMVALALALGAALWAGSPAPAGGAGQVYQVADPGGIGGGGG